MALILTKKVNEKIYIGDAVLTVVATDLKKKTVKLGIKAPPEMLILRKELQDASRRQDEKPAE